jgi:PAS domain S-box-containing protein
MPGSRGFRLCGRYCCMTVATIDQTVSITRCGLCKIDRKGRFILANQEAQRLLGLSEVELFGRPFIDFIRTSDRPTYQQLIKNRNPYDTGYDSAAVTMVSADGQTRPVTLVASINFGGGTPANYQIIIRPDDAPTQAPDSETVSWETLLRILVLEFDQPDFRKLVDLLRDVTGAAVVSLHDLSDEHHGCLASTDGAVADLAQLDNELKQNKDGSKVPDEVRATFNLGPGRTALVRFASVPSDSKENEAQVRWRCELAASLIHAVRSPQESEAPPAEQATTYPAQVLDQLRIGFVAFDRVGLVTQHNRTFESFFSPPGDLTQVSQIVALIGAECGEGAASAIDGYMSVLAGCDCLPGFKATYDMVEGRSLSIEILPLESSPEQASHCFLFYESEAGPARPSIGRGVSSQVGTTAIELLKSTMDATTSVWQKLEHEHHDQLNRDGGFYLGCLSHHLDTMSDTIRDFERMLKLIGDEEEAQKVDLGLLITRVTDGILETHPGTRLVVRHNELPKVTVPLRKLTAVLHDVLDISAQVQSERTVEATVTASVENGTCVIWVRDNGSGLNSRQKKTLFTLRRSFAKDKTGKPGGLSVGVAVAREIIASINGTLELDSRPGKGTIIKIVFPTR